MTAKADLVRSAIWARELDADEIERASHGVSERNFSKGSYICHRGDKFDYWTGVITAWSRSARSRATARR